MPAKPTVEILAANGFSDLAEALSFSVSNAGDVDAEMGFEQSGAFAPLPAGTSIQFEFVGARYEGRLYVRFPAAADGAALNQKVSIIKITHHC